MRLFCLGLLLFLPQLVLAQTDFTRQLMNSGRFEVKKTSPKASPSPTRSPASTKEEAAEPAKVAAPPVEKAPEATKLETSASVETSAEPSLHEQVESLMGGNYEKVQSFYGKTLDPEDPRLNKVEIFFLPGISSFDSKSNYSYRNYNSTFAAIHLESHVWMTPSVGLIGSLDFSLGASLPGDPATKSMIPARYEAVEMGVLFRRFESLSLLSPSFEYGFLFSDETFNVPTDNNFRPRLKSSGFGLSARTYIPKNQVYSWIIGGRLHPRLQHSEGKTGLSIRSGSPAENVRLAVEAGGEARLHRGSALRFLFGARAERNLFDGAASPVDPETGQAPSNVTVTNLLFQFSFGYTWGH